MHRALLVVLDQRVLPGRLELQGLLAHPGRMVPSVLLVLLATTVQMERRARMELQVHLAHPASMERKVQSVLKVHPATMGLMEHPGRMVRLVFRASKAPLARQELMDRWVQLVRQVTTALKGRRVMQVLQASRARPELQVRPDLASLLRPALRTGI